MPRTTALSRWVRRPRRRSWSPDTREPDFATDRVINGARPGRGA